MDVYLNNQPNTNAKIKLVQGDTLSINLTLEDDNAAVINLTAYTAKLTVRSSPTLTGTSIISLSSAGGSPAITLGSTSPNLVISVAAATTAAWEKGLFYYDLELTNGSGVKRTYLFSTFEIVDHITT